MPFVTRLNESRACIANSRGAVRFRIAIHTWVLNGARAEGPPGEQERDTDRVAMALESMLARNFWANRIWMLNRKGTRPESKNTPNSHFISLYFKLYYLQTRCEISDLIHFCFETFECEHLYSYIDCLHYYFIFNWTVQSLTDRRRWIVNATRKIHALHDVDAIATHRSRSSIQVIDNRHYEPALVIMPCARRYVMISDSSRNQAMVISGVKRCRYVRKRHLCLPSPLMANTWHVSN